MSKAALFLFFSIFLLPLVTSSSYNLEFNQVDDKVLVEHSISLDSIKTISLAVPEDAYSISSNLEYNLQNNVLTIFGDNIELSYITRDLLETSKEGYYLIDKIIFPSNFDTLDINLLMKEGYFTDSKRIFPAPSSIDSDGSQIMVHWTLQDIKQGEDLPIFVSITSPTSFTSVSVWILIIVLSLFIIYFFYDKVIKSRLSQKSSQIESHLIESEKAVLSALKEADRGEMWQKQLQLKTGFSKAKLSRVIRNLESRNLVEKIPFGNTNKVRLK